MSSVINDASRGETYDTVFSAEMSQRAGTT